MSEWVGGLQVRIAVMSKFCIKSFWLMIPDEDIGSLCLHLFPILPRIVARIFYLHFAHDQLLLL